MAVNKARVLASVLGANSLVSPDSDFINSSYNKSVAVTTGTMSVYSSIDSLPTSAIAGTKALVTSTNTLYIYSGGWYKIAIINNFNLQWVTEPDSEYTLDLDNIDSELIITVLANDSDDVPITYSVVLDSDANQLINIVHDSDKDNRWRVSLQDSDQGSGSVTFRASDGVNIISKNVTFNYTAGFPAGFIEYETFESSPSNLVGYDNGSGYSFAVTGIGGSGVTFTTSSGTGLITKNGAYDAGFVKQYSFTNGNTYNFYADGLSLNMVLNNRVILFIGTTSGGAQKANLGEWTSNGDQSKSWTANETGVFYVTLRSVTTNTAGSFSLDAWRISES